MKHIRPTLRAEDVYAFGDSSERVTSNVLADCIYSWSIVVRTNELLPELPRDDEDSWMLTISYINREEEPASSYEAAVARLKDRYRQAVFSKDWEKFGADHERQLVWANPSDAACDTVGFRAVAQILRPLPPQKKRG